MKKVLWMLTIPVLVVVLLTGLFGACRNPLRDGWLTGSDDVRLSFIIPDYFNRTFPAPANQPRIIDPATFSIDITVSAGDMETVT